MESAAKQEHQTRRERREVKSSPLPSGDSHIRAFTTDLWPMEEECLVSQQLIWWYFVSAPSCKTWKLMLFSRFGVSTHGTISQAIQSASD